MVQICITLKERALESLRIISMKGITQRGPKTASNIISGGSKDDLIRDVTRRVIKKMGGK